MAVGKPGFYLSTAHPAKFGEVIASVTGARVPLPERLEELTRRPQRSEPLAVDLAALEAYVEKAGDDSRALFALAETCAGLGDFPRAETFYHRAAFDPKFELASLYGLLRSAFAKRDYLGALEYARAVEKKQPSKEVSLYVKHLESFVSRAR